MATMQIKRAQGGGLPQGMNEPLSQSKYPYKTQRPSIPSYTDAYKRSPVSLLESLRILTKRMTKSTTTVYPILIDDSVIGPEDVYRTLRLCGNEMSDADYLFYLEKYISESTRKGAIVLHVDVLQTVVGHDDRA